MIDRINQYFQLPVSSELADHFRNDIGLTGDFLAIFDDLRDKVGDTRFHAERLNMPLRKYSDKSVIVGQKCLWELIRLAEIGLKATQKGD